MRFAAVILALLSLAAVRSGKTAQKVPAIYSLSTGCAEYGTATAVTVTGANFMGGARVLVNGSAVPTSVASSGSLTASLPPYTESNYSSTFQVKTKFGTSASVPFMLAAPLVITSPALPSGAVGEPYSFQMEASGGCPIP